jgi:hypothetical protein
LELVGIGIGASLKIGLPENSVCRIQAYWYTMLSRLNLVISTLIQLLQVEELSVTLHSFQMFCEEDDKMVFKVIEGGDRIATCRNWRPFGATTTEEELVRLLRVKHIFSGRFQWYLLVSLSISKRRLLDFASSVCLSSLSDTGTDFGEKVNYKTLCELKILHSSFRTEKCRRAIESEPFSLILHLGRTNL